MTNDSWWHDSSYDGTHEITELPGTGAPNYKPVGEWFGPFPTYTQAKADALAHHLAYKNHAQKNIDTLKRKPKKDWR